MTAWASGEETTDFAVDTLMQYLADEGGDLDQNAVRMNIGLLNLCGLLLTRIHGETGVTALATLRDIAGRYPG